MTSNKSKGIAHELKSQVMILGGLVALMWILEFIDLFLFRGRLDAYGVLPRNIIGLRGILFMPFLHGGWPHLIANTVPFITLGWLVMLRETSDFFIVTAVTMLVSGMGVWLFGSPGFHIGASGVIFGYLGYLLLRGFFERNLVSILLSVLVGFLYGGIIWGVLPLQQGVSWEGHLFGLIGGVFAARFLSRKT
ncbi:rhomboid family intramembrane serine protease [Phormidium sp. CCY1219]|uniref:rhomboid family intramembrane serine protease n=1 Tax=Phormidium sp. CCY1219 TaxID=2886104 RepID=UPI002D1EE6BA|nr:rhomboid family intramembrane serine protease [Phormidium sp. CCY1219]MEB3826307.1 rhomboid family intramembrane serine protease [Phormidium sp. CCY1219]